MSHHPFWNMEYKQAFQTFKSITTMKQKAMVIRIWQKLDYTHGLDSHPNYSVELRFSPLGWGRS